jgi:hypothetical protein
MESSTISYTFSFTSSKYARFGYRKFKESSTFIRVSSSSS